MGRAAVQILTLLAALAAAAPASADLLDFSAAERRAILRHGPWPPAWAPDPSNRVSGKADAAALGQRLFFDARLSPGGVACAACHKPERAWTDGRPVSHGLDAATRNAPSLLDTRLGAWFGWGGEGDSLWAQSLRPILDPREMGGSAAGVAALLRGDGDLACRYRRVFGAPPPEGVAGDAAALVDAAKALAAFQETLVSPRAPFDDFRDALASGDAAAAGRYPLAAQRGLKLFLGRGNCAQCHVGPAFTTGEFHDIGIPFFVAPGKVDPGRHAGIRALQASPWNRLGLWSDDTAGTSATRTRHVALQQRNWGEFKVPSLRNASLTAPYMHNGSKPTLADVVRHYSELDESRLHMDGERILKPLHLTAAESADLVAFLESLTGAPPPPLPAPVACIAP